MGKDPSQLGLGKRVFDLMVTATPEFRRNTDWNAIFLNTDELIDCYRFVRELDKTDYLARDGDPDYVPRIDLASYEKLVNFLAIELNSSADLPLARQAVRLRMIHLLGILEGGGIKQVQTPRLNPTLIINIRRCREKLREMCG